MLATENSLRKLLIILAVAMLAALTGCTPAGPRALLRGDGLLRDGKYSQAIEALTEATRLMPDEPRAWNLLGLAYHRAGQASLAKQAYQQALTKDRSNRVAIAHYNLGCLLLEQNSPVAAADQLKSFTLTTNSEAGLVKLATAQLRLRQLDAAERNFAAALRLNAKNAEALNGIGVIHAQKNQRDAGQYFNTALDANPKYAPALLNSGVLMQQTLATRSNALHRFQEYVATAPGSAHVDSIKLLVRQLELELAPRASAPSVIANASLKTNALLAALQASNAIPQTSAPAPSRLTLTGTNAKPNATVAKTNAPIRVAETDQIAKTTNAPTVVPTNVPMTIVIVSNRPPPKVIAAEPSPVAEAPKPSPRTAVPPPSEDSIATPAFETTKEVPKRGLFARLNPFRGKPPETNDVPRAIVLNQPANGTGASVQRTFSRYTYLSPAPPPLGNRKNAERAMGLALKAQRGGDTNAALREFQRAMVEDPSYFEAQYNAALFALQLGDLSRALAGCEMALAIQPESINARYNLALALKQANYALDAVSELDRIVEAKPNDPRAHLVLGNLYSQQLNEPRKARMHYLKLLELEPRNAQASAIRFWLAANP